MTFEILPRSAFGLPQDGHTVLPAGPQTIVSDVFHGRTGLKASWGTLSRYRPEEERIQGSWGICGLRADVDDNFLRVHVSAENQSAALDQARTAVDRFTDHLGLLAGRSVSAQAILVEAEEGDAQPAESLIRLGWTTTYDTTELREQIDVAAASSVLDDDRLSSALRYYQHGLWLFEQQAKLADPRSPDGAMLVSSVFLNLWKAASAVIGDPAKDKDHQTRYRALGFDDDYFRTRIKPLRDLRNDSDVAHYSLRGTDLDQLKAVIGMAASVVQELLLAQARILRDGQ